MKEVARVRINVKTLKLVALITLIAVICVSISAGYVQAANEATVNVSLSKYTPSPGDEVIVTINVQSNVAQDMHIVFIGVHGDWMDLPTTFRGANLQDNPITLSAGSSYAGSIILPIPTNTTLGTHNYIVRVEATDDSNNDYVWNSTQSVIQVIGGSSSSSTPTQGATSNPNSGGSTDFMLYIAIVAIVVMVVLALLVLLMLRKRTRSRSAQKPTSNSPSQPPTPAQEPPEEKPSSGENFDI